MSGRQGMKHTWGTSATGGGERPTCDTDIKEPSGVAAIVGTDRVCREGGAVPIWDVEGHHGGESIYFSVSDGLISHKDHAVVRVPAILFLLNSVQKPLPLLFHAIVETTKKNGQMLTLPMPS